MSRLRFPEGASPVPIAEANAEDIGVNPADGGIVSVLPEIVLVEDSKSVIVMVSVSVLVTVLKIVVVVLNVSVDWERVVTLVDVENTVVVLVTGAGVVVVVGSINAINTNIPSTILASNSCVPWVDTTRTGILTVSLNFIVGTILGGRAGPDSVTQMPKERVDWSAPTIPHKP